MRWNLRAAAARRGIASAAELRRRLASAGLVVSVGKMSGLWAHTPLTVRLEDLEVLCTVLSCEPSDLLIPEPPPARTPASAPGPAPDPASTTAAFSAAATLTTPAPATGRATAPVPAVPVAGRAVRRVIVRSVPPA
ncbi:helix-turn-helix transcriptional regulator [Streptomyces sp. NPDC005813]|uniref:helix-turn-helix domain-containing protein n=1 Tax=Streptomyces sp. NPDC005813 TaxID=3155592 RepID=UPI0034017E6E